MSNPGGLKRRSLPPSNSNSSLTQASVGVDDGIQDRLIGAACILFDFGAADARSLGVGEKLLSLARRQRLCRRPRSRGRCC